MSGEARITLTVEQVVLYITLAMIFIHILLFILFFHFHVHIMAAVNVLSIMLYTSCFVWLRCGKSPYTVFNLCYAEIIIHAILATWAVGSSCGFLLYMMCMVPIVYYAVYSFNNSGHKASPNIYILATIVAFIISQYAAYMFKPLYNIESSVIQVIYIVNYLLVLIIIAVFMSTFLMQIRTLEEIMRKKNQWLEVLSTQDVLTGLANRRSIHESYRRIVEQNQDYAVILGDIDDFKRVNDTYGHACGDSVLQAVADAFKMSVSECDVVCRWGGEEILVLLPDCDKNVSYKIAERIADEVRSVEIIGPEKNSIFVTMTFGVASSKEGKDMKDVIKKADNRLYYGKEHGKNCVVKEMGP